MSRFFSEKYKDLTPYTPGEQPQDMQYVKLNTNESPFPPCEAVIAAAAESAESLRLYPDPDCKALVNALASVYGVSPAQITVNNGSDETLNFAFMAYCDADHPAIFPDITYGFYPVFAALNGIPYEEVPLKADFGIDLEAIMASRATAFIANPNAPPASPSLWPRSKRCCDRTPTVLWWWTRPTWISARKAPCRSSIHTITCWWCKPFPNPAPWRGADSASASAARRSSRT